MRNTQPCAGTAGLTLCNTLFISARERSPGALEKFGLPLRFPQIHSNPQVKAKCPT